MSESEVASLRQGLAKLRKSLRRKLPLAPAGLALFEAWEGVQLVAIMAMPMTT